MQKSTHAARVPKTYWFGSLADHALMQELGSTHDHDRATTARLVALLAEVERRRLFLPAGYASLYRYCVGSLHMSEDVAWKRIQVSRTARRHPAIFKILADGRLSLTTVVLLDRHLTRGNAAELFDAAKLKSKREVLELLAARFPQAELATSITPVALTPIAAPAVTQTHARARVACDSTSPAPERVPELSCQSGAPPDTPRGVSERGGPLAGVAAPARVTPLAPERYALQVTLARATHEKLRRAQELLGHAIPSGDVAQVLDRALTLLVAQLEKRRCGVAETPRPRKRQAHGRHVPAEVRRQVYARDQHRCTFVSETGHCCDERSRLELDHVTPLARGGDTTAANIRLRCRAHNQHQAERVFGEGFMEQKRAAARSRAMGHHTPAVPIAPAPQAQPTEAENARFREDIGPCLGATVLCVERSRPATALSDALPEATRDKPEHGEA